MTELPNAWDMQRPPRLHWGWVLFLNMFTGGIFGAFWMLLIARWVKRVRGHSNAHGWAVVYLVFAVLGIGEACASRGESGFSGGASFILYFVVAFLLQGELQEAPIGLSLSSVMVFFFAPIYFQYFLHDFGDRSMSRAGRLIT